MAPLIFQTQKQFSEVPKNTNIFLYFPVFGLNTGKYGPEKTSVFGHFSRSVKPAFIILY